MEADLTRISGRREELWREEKKEFPIRSDSAFLVSVHGCAFIINNTYVSSTHSFFSDSSALLAAAAEVESGTHEGLQPQSPLGSRRDIKKN